MLSEAVEFTFIGQVEFLMKSLESIEQMRIVIVCFFHGDMFYGNFRSVLKVENRRMSVGIDEADITY